MRNIIWIGTILTLCAFWGCERRQNKPTEPIMSAQNNYARRKLQAIKNIDSLENQIRLRLRDSSDATPNIELSMYAAQAYQDYALDFTQDRLAPEYLMRSASVLHGALQDPSRAAEIYGQVHNKYPDYERRPLALFLQANALHDANQNQAAVTQLRLFLIRYPQDSLASQARQLIIYIKKPFIKP